MIKAYVGNSWNLLKDSNLVTIGDVQAQKLYVSNWRYLGFVATMEFTVLAREVFDAVQEQVKRDFASTSPDMTMLIKRYFAFAKTSGQREGLNAIISFSGNKRIIVSGQYAGDKEATPDGQYLYFHQVGIPQVFKLPGLFLHPSQAVNAVPAFREHASAVWQANLEIPEFLNT